MLELILLELGALPKIIPIGCKSGGVVCLNSNPAPEGFGKNSASAQLRRKRKYRDRGDLHWLIVKSGKGESGGCSVADGKAFNRKGRQGRAKDAKKSVSKKPGFVPVEFFLANFALLWRTLRLRALGSWVS